MRALFQSTLSEIFNPSLTQEYVRNHHYSLQVRVLQTTLAYVANVAIAANGAIVAIVAIVVIVVILALYSFLTYSMQAVTF